MRELRNINKTALGRRDRNLTLPRDTVSVCGVPNRKQRIVGGQVTKVNEFPWIVALTKRGKFYCAGSLITRRHVLTAAHCTHG
jgi:guanylate cyclase